MRRRIRMTKEQLLELGLDESQIKEVFRLNGLAIGKVQTDLDAKAQELLGTKDLLDKANEKIGTFKDLDVEAIKKEAKEYKDKFELAKTEAEQKIKALEYETALKEYVGKHNFASDRVKTSIFNDIKSKEFKYEDGQFLGVDDYIKQLQEKEPESFVKVEGGEEGTPRFTRPSTNDNNPRQYTPKTIAELAEQASIRK